MNRDRLLALLAGPESQSVERTQSAKDTDKLGETICAFANDLPNTREPGYLFIGATDDGRPSGLAVTDKLLLDLVAIRANGNILPQPVINVEPLSTPAGDVAVIEVLPSDLPPVRYKSVVWVRIGPSCARASEADERVLAERRSALAKTWDARACAAATIDDLALDLFTISYRPRAVASEVVEANRRSMEEQLAALRFFDLRAARPTYAAVLVFAKDVRSFVEGAYARYVRYEGPTKAARVRSERRFEGDLASVLRGLDQFALDVAGAHPVRGPDLADRTVYDYPPDALHELLVNAVIHRNYEGSTAPIAIDHFSDRIEIINPGGLYGELTPDLFTRLTTYRNPILAEAAKILGFANRYGRGIAMVREHLHANGSPDARFDFGTNHVSVVVTARADQ